MISDIENCRDLVFGCGLIDSEFVNIYMLLSLPCLSFYIDVTVAALIFQ